MTELRRWNGFSGITTMAQLRQNVVQSSNPDSAIVQVQIAAPYSFPLNLPGTTQVKWQLQESTAAPHRMPLMWMHNDAWASPPTGEDTGGMTEVIRKMPSVPDSINGACVAMILPYVTDSPVSTDSNSIFRTLLSFDEASSRDYYDLPLNTDLVISLRLRLMTDACRWTGLPMNTNSGNPSQMLLWQIHEAGGSGPTWVLQLRDNSDIALVRDNWNVPGFEDTERFVLTNGGVLGSNRPLDRWINFVWEIRLANSGGYCRLYASLDNDRATTKVFDWFEESGETRTKQAGTPYGPLWGMYQPAWIGPQSGAKRSVGAQYDFHRIASNENYLSDEAQPWAAIGGGGEDITSPSKPVIVLSAGTPDTSAIDATESVSTDAVGVTSWKFYQQSAEMILNSTMSTNDFAAGDGDSTTGWQRQVGSGWTISGGVMSNVTGLDQSVWTEPDQTVSPIVVDNYVEVEFDYTSVAGGTLTATYGANPDFDTDPENAAFVSAVSGSGHFKGIHKISSTSNANLRFKSYGGWAGTFDNVQFRKLLLDDTELAGAHSYTGLTENTLYRMNVQTLDAAANASVVSDTASLTTANSSPPVDPLAASPYSEDAVNKNSGTTTHTPIADEVPQDGTAPYFVLSVSPITGCQVSVASNVVTYQPNQTFSGNSTYSITFGDSSDPQQTVQTTVTVAVTNHNPVAIPQTGSLAIKCGVSQSITFSMSGFATDADADPLTFAVVDAAVGTFTVAADGVTGQYTAPGSAQTDNTGTFKAIDDSSAESSAASIVFEVVTPSAINDNYVLERGDGPTYVLDVLANDQDPLDVGLTITAINGLGTEAVNVGHAEVTVVGDGPDDQTLLYVPTDPDTQGYTDSFTYTVSDGTSTNSGTVTVIMTALEDNPVEVSDGETVAVAMYSPLKSGQADLSTRAEAALGGNLSYFVEEQAAYGTATIDSNGIMTYTPQRNKTGLMEVKWAAQSDSNNIIEGQSQFFLVNKITRRKRP